MSRSSGIFRTDRQTDRQTDGQTNYVSAHLKCVAGFVLFVSLRLFERYRSDKKRQNIVLVFLAFFSGGFCISALSQLHAPNSSM